MPGSLHLLYRRHLRPLFDGLFGWRVVDSGPLRAATYELGNFTPSARRLLDRTFIIRVPPVVAGCAARLAALIPGWVPGTGAWTRTGTPTALEAAPIGITFVTDCFLSPGVIAHEFTHYLYYRLPKPLRQGFPDDFRKLIEADSQFRVWLREHGGMERYGNPWETSELHQRVIEFHEYGRRELPGFLRRYYAVHFQTRRAEQPE